MDPEKVTKIDVAGRQLQTAIRLFLAGDDSISIHTLTAASLQIVMDLGEKVGIASIVKNLAFVRPEKREFFRSLVNSAENFFKHADRDPEATLEFHPAATPFYIADAVALYTKLGGNDLPVFRVFQVWYALNYPDVLEEGEMKEAARKLLAEDPTLKDRGVALHLLRHLEGKG